MVGGPAASTPGRAADRPLLRVIDTPGHAADHLSYLLLPHGWVFTGDLVLGEGSSAVLHPDGRMDDYLASIRKLEALAPRRLLPGHGPPVADAPGRLAEYRLHRLDRERQIVEAIEAGADSVPAIRAAVYGPLPPGLTMAAEASISAHLVRLRDAGMEVPVPGPGMFESSAPNADDDESPSGRAR
jgi:glyoxylase-like metal-dependent hydrolase (beta-lactamase superfamily II)